LSEVNYTFKQLLYKTVVTDAAMNCLPWGVLQFWFGTSPAAERTSSANAEPEH